MGCNDVPEEETDASVRMDPIAATAEDWSVDAASPPERSRCRVGGAGAEADVDADAKLREGLMEVEGPASLSCFVRLDNIVCGDILCLFRRRSASKMSIGGLCAAKLDGISVC